MQLLLIEDSSMARLVIERHLKAVGWKVVSAVDGWQALAWCLKQPFDLIVTDRELPDFNGEEFARRLRSRRNPNRHTPVVALSATVTPEIAEDCAKSGIVALFEKPLQRRDVISMLRHALPKAG
ncbi:MAG: response regulator [Myxococcaceae bacterium]